MARRLFEQRAKTVNFDIDSLVNDDAVKSGFLCLSESTWELAYNLVLEYGHWRSRYFKTNSMTGDLETITDDEYENTVLPVYYLAVEELNMSGCTDLVASVDNLTAQVGLINVALQNSGGGCGCDGGSLEADPLDSGDVPDPGAPYLAAKCRAANVILDKVVFHVRQLDGFNVDDGFGALIGLATTLVISALLAGPVGWAVALTLGAASGIVAIWATLSGTDLGDLDTALATFQDDLICSLYNATDAASAKAAFLTVLDDNSVSSALQSLVGFMLSINTLNELFVQTGTYSTGTDYLANDYVPTDCEECGSDEIVFGRLFEFPDAQEFGGTGDLTQDGQTEVLTATLDENGFYYVTIKHALASSGGEFGCLYLATDLINGAGRGWAWYEWDVSENVLVAEAEGSQNPMPTQDLGGVTAVVWIGAQSFTVTVRLTDL